MNRVKVAPYFLSMLLLTLGAAGVVSAYSSLPQYRDQLLAQLEDQPVPLSDEAESAADQPKLSEPAVDHQTLKPIEEPVVGPIVPRVDNRVDFLNDWYQAGAKRQAASEVKRLHVIFMDATRALTGRISVLGQGQTFRVADETLTVHFMQHGRIVRSIPLGSDGRFSVTGLSKGAYGLGVLGSDTMLAYSVYLGSVDDLVAAGYDQPRIAEILDRQASEPLQIDSVSISPTDYPMALDLVREAVSRNPTRRSTADNLKLEIPENVEFASARAGTTLRNHVVKLRADGRLLGRVRKPVDQANGKVAIESIPGVELIFLQNNAAVTTSITDVNGEFEVIGLSEGNYSLVARSVEGIAVLGIRVYPSTARLNVNRDIQGPASGSVMPVSFDETPEEENKDLNLDAGNLEKNLNEEELNLTDLQLDVTLMDDFGLLLEEVPAEELFEGAAAADAFGGVAGAAGAGGGLLGFLLGGLIGGLIGGSLDDDDPPSGEEPVTPDMP